MYLTNDRRLLCIPRRSRTGHGQRVRCGAANPRTVNTGRGDRRSYAWGLAIRAVVLPMPQSSPPGGATRRSRCNGSPPRPRTARNDPGAPSRAGAEPDARTHSRSSREAGATQCATGSDEFRPSDGSDRHELWIGGGERATRTSRAAPSRATYVLLPGAGGDSVVLAPGRSQAARPEAMTSSPRTCRPTTTAACSHSSSCVGWLSNA